MITSCVFFLPALAVGLSLGSKGQQVFSGVQVSSQHSNRSKQCCSLGCLHSSSHFQVILPFYQSFGNCTKCTDYNWYNRHFHVPQFFSIPKQGLGNYPSFHFLSILLWSARQQNPQFCKFNFLLIIIRSGRLAMNQWFICISKSCRSLCVSAAAVVVVVVVVLYVFFILTLNDDYLRSLSNSKSLLNSCRFQQRSGLGVFRSSSNHFSRLWGQFLGFQIQLVSLSLSCSQILKFYHKVLVLVLEI